MNDFDSLTLTFKITDKEKFKEFHKKVFMYKREDTDKIAEELGGYAVISSWSNPFRENEKIESALDYALRKLDFEESEICKLISEGKTEEEAVRITELSY